MSDDPESRVAVVTGASAGVGLQISKRLVERGWSVVGFSRRAVAPDADDLGDRFDLQAVDVRNFEQVAAAVSRVAESHGAIDLLVNNAARFKMASYADCSADDIDAIVDTNLKGAMYCTLCALPHLRRPGGRIVNIASVAATHGIAGQAIYCGSKYGMDGFAEALAQELEPEGILVTTIYPGGIDTPLWNESNPYPGDLSRLLQSDDVAAMVEHVAGMPSRIVCKKIVLFPSNEWH